MYSAGITSYYIVFSSYSPPCVQTCTGPIRSTLDKAYKMFSARAYVHQYEQFGLEEHDFDGSFARCEELVAAYDSM